MRRGHNRAPTQPGGFRTRGGRVAFVCGLVVAMLALQALALTPIAITQNAKAATASSADLSIGSLQDVDSLNPYIGVNDAAYLLYGLIYDYPYAFDQDGNSIPNIITNAQCTDKTCRNWTYQVRQGVYWSDHSLLTADDVAFTWSYDSQDLFHLWAYEPYFNRVVQCGKGQKTNCAAVVTSPWNVTVYFDRPFVAGQDLFGPIVQKAQWSGVSPQAAEYTYLNANPIGTGPFIADPNIYTQWLNRLSGTPLRVTKNPNYHPVGSHTGPVGIDTIYIYFFSDPNSLALALLANKIQIAAMTPSGIRTVKGQPNIQVQEALQAIQEWDEIGISQIDTPAANGRLNPARWDLNVRRAMAMATNKDYIVRTIYNGKGVRGDSLMSPITPQWWYDPVAGGDNLTFSLAAANRLLNDSKYTTWSGGSFGNGYRMAASPITVSFQTACYQCLNPPNVTKTIPAGTPLSFTLATRTEFKDTEGVTATYLAAEWAKVGIQLTVKQELESALSTDVYGGYVDAYIWYWSGDPDPNYLLSIQSSWTLDGWSDNYWNNASYNHYYVAQLGDTNYSTRQADTRAAQKVQYESAVYIIYIFPYGEWAYRTDLWQGWGDWVNHPYRQINAYWGANPLFFDLTCPSCVSTSGTYTKPVIQGRTYLGAYTNTSVSLSATTTDANPSDTLTWTWNWGDGNTTSSTATAGSTPSATGNHMWPLPGNYTVNVGVEDGVHAALFSNPVYVNVAAKPPNTGVVQGTVTSESGAAIQSAQVRASPGGLFATTDATGAYKLTLVVGSYDLTATAQDFGESKKSVTITAGGTATVDFTLTASVGWIVGTVRDKSTGSPISGVTISVRSSGGAIRVGSTNATGNYNVSETPGTYSVNASLPGQYIASQQDNIAVNNGQAVQVNFQLVSVPNVGAAGGLSPPVIAAIGAIIVVAVAATAVTLLRRRKKKEEETPIDLPPK